MQLKTKKKALSQLTVRINYSAKCVDINILQSCQPISFLAPLSLAAAHPGLFGYMESA